MNKLPICVILCLALAPVSDGTAQQRSNPCSVSATLAEVEIEAISRYFMCGTVGLVEVVVRARVLRELAGPRLGRTFLGVIPCPGPNIDPGARMTVCVGEPAPRALHQRLDSFESDPRPRLYLRRQSP